MEALGVHRRAGSELWSTIVAERKRGWLTARTGQRGSTAVEFALVATPLIWILGVICETAAFIVVQYQLQYAVDRTARLIVTNSISAADVASVSAFKAKVCEFFNAPNCNDAINVDLRSADTFTDLALPNIGEIGPASPSGTYTDTFTPGSATKPGSLIVTYDWKFAFPFMGRTFSFGNVDTRTDVRRLHGIAIYMREPL